MRAEARFLPIGVSVLLAVSLAATAALSGLMEESRLLESELRLAEKSAIYCIFNLEENRVLIKARGVILREFVIEGSQLWGRTPPITPLRLVSRSALLEPKRKDARAKKQEDQPSGADKSTDTFEVEALELKDMPSSFRLDLSEAVYVSIRPTPQGRLGTLLDILSRLVWRIKTPILGAWHLLRGHPFTAIHLQLGGDDARHLYWSFPQGSEAIVYRPTA